MESTRSKLHQKPSTHKYGHNFSLCFAAQRNLLRIFVLNAWLGINLIKYLPMNLCPYQALITRLLEINCSSLNPTTGRLPPHPNAICFSTKSNPTKPYPMQYYRCGAILLTDTAN